MAAGPFGVRGSNAQSWEKQAYGRPGLADRGSKTECTFLSRVSVQDRKGVSDPAHDLDQAGCSGLRSTLRERMLCGRFTKAASR
jgi:hypothetical protein